MACSLRGGHWFFQTIARYDSSEVLLLKAVATDASLNHRPAVHSLKWNLCLASSCKIKPIRKAGRRSKCDGEDSET